MKTLDSVDNALDDLLDSLNAISMAVREENDIDPADHATSGYGGEGTIRGAALVKAASLYEICDRLRDELYDAREIINRQKQELTELHAQCRTDPLTSLLNRRGFDEELKRQLSIAERNQHPIAILMLDIDHFKHLNDTYGHQAGDKVLKGIANILFNTLRSADRIGRYGGEEFIALLPETHLMDACRVAERVRLAVEGNVFQFDDLELHVTISVGVSIICGDSALANHIIRTADDALYGAKAGGRNCVHVCDGDTSNALTYDLVSNDEGQRRSYVRFNVEGLYVEMALPSGPWIHAEVLNESLDGMAVKCKHRPEIREGEPVRINYLGNIRLARICYRNDLGGEMRVGMCWL